MHTQKAKVMDITEVIQNLKTGVAVVEDPLMARMVNQILEAKAQRDQDRTHSLVNDQDPKDTAKIFQDLTDNLNQTPIII